MYSVVLATMLAAGSSTPAYCHNYCHSCYGGYHVGGYSYYSGCSCYGSCYSSCSYSYGCSCYSSCSCYRSCHHFSHFHQFNHFHHFRTFCHCSCSTPIIVVPTYYYGCYGCCGCCGGVSYSVGCAGYIPVSTPKIVPVGGDTPAPAPTGGNTVPSNSNVRVVSTNNEQAAAQPARVTVLVPAQARLWVDQVECPLTSSVRSFNTPPLNANQQYFYNLKVEVARDGRTISETQRVLLTPGQETRVDFNNVGALRTVSR